MSVMRIAKIIMPLLLLAMLNCRPAAAEISVDGDWGKARFYVFRPDPRTAASTLQFRQSPHKAVLRYQHEAIKTQANFNTEPITAIISTRSGPITAIISTAAWHCRGASIGLHRGRWPAFSPPWAWSRNSRNTVGYSWNIPIMTPTPRGLRAGRMTSRSACGLIFDCLSRRGPLI